MRLLRSGGMTFRPSNGVSSAGASWTVHHEPTMRLKHAVRRRPHHVLDGSSKPAAGSR